MSYRRHASILIGIALLAVTAAGWADQNVKIKNVAKIEGARSNQLYGYGLVIGLDGTGDTQQSLFTPQSVANMLQKFGITVPADRLKVKNVAAVIVTADLPPFVPARCEDRHQRVVPGRLPQSAGRNADPDPASSRERAGLRRRAREHIHRRLHGRDRGHQGHRRTTPRSGESRTERSSSRRFRPL